MQIEKIRRKAATLGFQVDTSRGFLDITKPDDPTLFFSSVQPINDPRTLVDAEIWLQCYHNNLVTLDLMCAAKAKIERKPRKRHVRYAIAWLLQAFVAGIVLALSLHRLPDVWAAVAFLALLLSMGIFPLPKSARR